jgi:hypothetical protein
MRILMTGLSLFRSALALSAVALCAGCAEMETPNQPVAVAPTPPPGYWNGDGVPGSPKIVVNITAQRAYFYKGKQLVGESTVSTGKAGFSTPPGHYQVLIKDKEHVSSVFGDYVDDLGNVVKSNIDSRKDPRPKGSHYDGARMPYAMFFRGGYAMHQGYVPPYAASHGCIRVPREMAETFFNNAPVGTPVIVKEEAVTHTVSVPPPPLPPTTVVPPAPAPFRAPPVRSTTTALTPIPVRSPALVVSRAPAPAPLRPPSPAPVRSPVPVPVRPPAPALIRPTAAPVLSPTPGPFYSQTQHHVRSRAYRRLPTPSPTPPPASAR